jgi:hypothetical protein
MPAVWRRPKGNRLAHLEYRGDVVSKRAMPWLLQNRCEARSQSDLLLNSLCPSFAVISCKGLNL